MITNTIMSMVNSAGELKTHSILWTSIVATDFTIAAVELIVAFLFWKAKEKRMTSFSLVFATSFIILGILEALSPI